MRGRRKKKERNLIARFRCENEMRGNQHWKEEEEKKYKICKQGIENITHVLTECGMTKKNDERGVYERWW